MEKYFELLFLKQLRGFGNVKMNRYLPLVEKTNGIKELIDEIHNKESSLDKDTLMSALEKARNKMQRYVSQDDLRIITVFDDDYPKSFFDLKERKPLILYAKGNYSLLNTPSISIVGTRKPSEYTEKVSYGLIKNIVVNTGKTIVSGLALGCDGIAHKAAMRANGYTVAVLPSGVNVITPSKHKMLAQSILDTGGCLVSEYEPDAKAVTATYVERDTLIAALTDATFVLQCGIKSGTMHTVRAADKLHRRIGCIYSADEAYGDMSGNQYMVEEFNAFKVSGKNELNVFLNSMECDHSIVNETTKDIIYDIKDEFLDDETEIKDKSGNIISCNIKKKSSNQDEDLIIQCIKRFPVNTDLDIVAMKISLVDFVGRAHLAMYMNQINLYELARTIVEIRDFDTKIQNGDQDVVVAVAKTSDKVDLVPFVKQYCNYHNRYLYHRSDYVH